MSVVMKGGKIEVLSCIQATKHKYQKERRRSIDSNSKTKINVEQLAPATKEICGNLNDKKNPAIALCQRDFQVAEDISALRD